MQHLGDHYGGEMVTWKPLGTAYTGTPKAFAALDRSGETAIDGAKARTGRPGSGLVRGGHRQKAEEAQNHTARHWGQSAFDTAQGARKTMVPTLVSCLSPDRAADLDGGDQRLAAMDARSKAGVVFADPTR